MPTAPDLNKMITWAMQQEGKTSYECRGRGMHSTARSTCQRFVSSCYFEGGQRPYAGASTAKEAMHMWKVSGTENDLKPPIGAAVYMQGSGKGCGHVGLSLGDGKFIDAGASTIKVRNVTTGSGTYHYLGWGWNGGTKPVGSPDVNVDFMSSVSSDGQQSGFLGGGGGQVYTTKSTRADALLREVGYMSDTLEPLIKSSTYKLSVVNYTSLLGFTFAGSTNLGGSVSGDVNIDNIDNPNCKRIFELLLNKGFTAAQCVGILANIRQESGYNPAAVNSIGASGICQWYQGRATNMKKFVVPDWKNNIDGQVEFLMSELESSYKNSVLEPILAVTDNTFQGALQVMEIFLKKFEIPGNYSEEMKRRSKFAEDLWSKIVIQPTSGTSSTNRYKTKGKVTTQSGNVLTQGVSYSVPTSLNQMDVSAGIYTWYKRNWSARSNQGKVYSAWRSLGEKYSDKVATLDGYYLIAMSQSFGVVGDIVTIELDNGNYFNAILGDAKGKESNSTYYGHVQGKSTNVVEWEMYYPEGKNGAKGNNQILQSALQSVGIKGKVTNIINYGSWLK